MLKEKLNAEPVVDNSANEKASEEPKRRWLTLRKAGSIALAVCTGIFAAHEVILYEAKRVGTEAGNAAGDAFAHTAKSKMSAYVENQLPKDISNNVTKGTDPDDLPPFAQDILVKMIADDPGLMEKLEKEKHLDINGDGIIGKPPKHAAAMTTTIAPPQKVDGVAAPNSVTP